MRGATRIPEPTDRGAPRPRGRVAPGATALLLLATGAPAQQPVSPVPLVTDRPDFTESASVVPALQVEAGYTLTGRGGLRDHELGELLVRLPLHQRAELRVGLGSWQWSAAPGPESSGFGDGFLGTKLLLLDGGAGGLLPGTALIVGSSVPTGRDSEDWQPEAILALAWDAREVGIGANLGYARSAAPEGSFDQGIVSLAVGVPLHPRLSLFLETFTLSRERPGGEPAYFGDGGLAWLLGPELQLDARLGRRLEAGGEHFVGVGASWRR